MALWRKLDISQSPVYYISDEDEIYYAREYISGGGYQASEANNLVSNFKKPIDRKALPEWKWKQLAIQHFARELSSLVGDKPRAISAIPSSKCKADPQYDSRLDDTLEYLTKIRPAVIIEEPISMRCSMPPVHSGGERNPNLIYSYFIWNDFKLECDHIILIDDVLTTGSHFSACKRMILEHYPLKKIIGVFWAKTIWT